MVAIVTSRTRLLYERLPQGPLVPNWASRQAIGLVGWYASGINSMVDWVNMVPPALTLTNTNGVTVGVDNEMGQVFTFDDAASEYFTIASAPMTAPPLSMTCWFLSNDTAVSPTLLDLHNSASAALRDSFQLVAENATDGLNIEAITGDSVGFSVAISVNAYRANTWSHAAFVSANSSDRRAFCNGTGKVTQSTLRAPSGINQTNLGRVGGSVPGSYISGMICDARIYNRVLQDTEVWEQFNPRTRWELYYQPGRVSYSFARVVAAVGGNIPPSGDSFQNYAQWVA